jgi:hypothetical protein
MAKKAALMEGGKILARVDKVGSVVSGSVRLDGSGEDIVSELLK